MSRQEIDLELFYNPFGFLSRAPKFPHRRRVLDDMWSVTEFFTFPELSEESINKKCTCTVNEKGQLEYKFILPGYEKEQIEVTTDVETHEGRQHSVIRVKADSGSEKSSASYIIKNGFKSDPVSAKLKNGILVITFDPEEKVPTEKKVNID